MVLKRFIAALFVMSLLLGAIALATDDSNSACLVSEKSDYKDLRNQFYDAEDNFLHYKSEYNAALLDHDQQQTNVYSYRLQNLDEDLQNLRDDVQHLRYNVEDVSNCSSQSDLLDNLKDLKSDINRLRDKISEALAEEKSTMTQAATSQGYMMQPAMMQPTVTPTAAAQGSEVVVSTLSVGPTAPTPTTAAVATTEKAPASSFNQTAWLVAGVVILLAVVLFLLGMLFRR